MVHSTCSNRKIHLLHKQFDSATSCCTNLYKGWLPTAIQLSRKLTTNIPRTYVARIHLVAVMLPHTYHLSEVPDVPEVIVYSNSIAGIAVEHSLELTTIDVDSFDGTIVCKEQVWFCGFCSTETYHSGICLWYMWYTQTCSSLLL